MSTEPYRPEPYQRAKKLLEREAAREDANPKEIERLEKRLEAFGYDEPKSTVQPVERAAPKKKAAKKSAKKKAGK